MTRRIRAILIGIAAVAIIAVAVVALLLRSLKGGDLRAGVEARLSAALGQPVSIAALDISLFPPSLTGTGVRVGESRVEAPAVQIDRVHILPRPRSAFTRARHLSGRDTLGVISTSLRGCGCGGEGHECKDHHDSHWSGPPMPMQSASALPFAKRVFRPVLRAGPLEVSTPETSTEDIPV